jgi:hypothetical protein
MGSQESVHVFPSCRGPNCNFIHDYIMKNKGFHACILPDSYTWDAIRKRISRNRKKGIDIQLATRDTLSCKKCGHFLWILEVPPNSSKYFEKAFKDALIHTPKDMKTNGEIASGSSTQKTAGFQPVERYLDIDNPPTDTYKDLLYEIDLCFTYQAYSASIVLIRKLVENLIVDLLRRKFGMTEVDLFYLTSQNRFRNLSELILNLRAKILDFGPYGLDKKHLAMLEKLREEGNSVAHSIIDHATKENLLELRPHARKAVKALFTVRELLFK